MKLVMTGLAGLSLAAAGACASAPKAGSIGETPAAPTRISAVDSSYPPRTVAVQLDQSAYAAVLLVAPGHSATLLYPRDSTVDNRLAAGAHVLPVTVPEALLETDSARIAGLIRQRDSARVRTRAPVLRLPALPPTTPTYFLVVTSPQPLSYRRIVEKITGVSIPLGDLEALNAVGKAVKATIEAEPRAWNGFYQLVALRRPT
jgi:hypothetical protein